MYGNFAAQAGIISNVRSGSPNLITPTLTWNFSGVLVLDFSPPGSENINDRPRINVWRDVNGTPDFNFIQYISGGKDILSPAPTGNIFDLWGDRRTGTYTFPTISVAKSEYIPFLIQKLTGDSVNDQFGWDVATNNNGTVLVMGGPLDNDGGSNAGAALVYTGNANAGWQLRQKLTGSASVFSLFGWSVATNNNGTVLVMGGPYDDDGGNNAGAALVYTGNANAGWQLRQKLTGNAFGLFGWDVATNNNGTVLVMGGPYDDDGGNNAGAALVYTGNANAGWQLRQKLTGDSANDFFGASVATNANGTVLVMGCSQDNDGGTSAGAALVYTGNANAGWQLRQKLTGDSTEDYFGLSIATNSDGTVLVMGGTQDNDGGTHAGAALVYTGNANAGWQLRQKLTGDSTEDYFGSSVATNSDGTVLVMGGYQDDDGGSNAGAALVYTGNANAGWQLRQKLTGDSTEDYFGSSVATNSDGTVLVMGGYQDDDGGSNAGAALVYTVPKFEITAGIDLFTFPYVQPISISPPLNQWTVTNSNIDELQYQYKFKVGETNPQINIVLDYRSDCKPVNIPNCDPLSQVLVYVGTNSNGCPIFSCKSRDSITSSSEIGNLYNPTSSWGNGLGRAEFGTWNIAIGSGSFRNIQFLSTTSPDGRTSVGSPAFYFVGNSGSNPTDHRIDLNLINPMISGSSLSLDVNYGWNGGSRQIIFRGNNNNFAQYRFSHSNNDELRYFRSGISNGSPSIENILITENAFTRAFNYELVHLGTGMQINVRLLPSNSLIYTEVASGNLNNLITGISFVTSNLPNILEIDYFNYGIFFNNINYKNLPPPPSQLFVKDIGMTNFTLFWADVFSATGYRLDIATDNNFNNYIPGYSNRFVTGRQHIITSLNKSTNYFARVRSVNTYGTGNFSPTLNVKTLENILELSYFEEAAADCAKRTILNYTNNSNSEQQLIIRGEVDDDLLINGIIYESGLYPYPAFSTCGYPYPINGAHVIKSFVRTLLPNESLLLEALNYGGNLGYNFNIRILSGSNII